MSHQYIALQYFMWMKLGMFDWCINNLFTNFNVKYVMKYSMKFNSFLTSPKAIHDTYTT